MQLPLPACSGALRIEFCDRALPHRLGFRRALMARLMCVCACVLSQGWPPEFATWEPRDNILDADLVKAWRKRCNEIDPDTWTAGEASEEALVAEPIVPLPDGPELDASCADAAAEVRPLASAAEKARLAAQLKAKLKVRLRAVCGPGVVRPWSVARGGTPK
jgi:hypothetical protein